LGNGDSTNAGNFPAGTNLFSLAVGDFTGATGCPFNSSTEPLGSMVSLITNWFTA
jgi:hypothetical protein